MYKTITAIVIDDMKLARTSLIADLNDHCPLVEVIAEADGVLSGAKAIKEHKVDMIFLDIEMQDGSGFDLLDILPEGGPSVVFVTARQEYALQAFRYAAVDYLLKPIDPKLLVKAVEKYAQMTSPRYQQLEILKSGLAENHKLERIALHTADKIEIVDLKDILRLEAMTNYTRFYMVDGSKLLITKTLKEYDEMLSDANFVRVHQSHLVNFAHIKSYVKSDGGYLLMKDNSMIPVSVRKKAYVVNLLN